MKDVPPLAQMASEIKDEIYDDEDDTLDAGKALLHAIWAPALTLHVLLYEIWSSSNSIMLVTGAPLWC